LQAMDKVSNGWQPYSSRPNMVPAIPQWLVYPVENGRRFYGWQVENGDEILQRNLRAEFRWIGDGPHTVESVVGGRSGCRADEGTSHPQHDATTGLFFEVGLALPDTIGVTNHSFSSPAGETQPAGEVRPEPTSARRCCAAPSMVSELSWKRPSTHS